MAVDHYQLLLRLSPRGDLTFDADTAAEADLLAAAAVLDHLWTQRGELLAQILPSQATGTVLERWESAYELYRLDSRTEAERQARATAAYRRLPNSRPATIKGIVEQLTGLTATIVEPGGFRTDDPDSLTDTTDDVLDGAHIFYVELASAAASTAGVDRAEVLEQVDRIRPAHTLAVERFTGAFLTDDSYSLTDQDLLGA